VGAGGAGVGRLMRYVTLLHRQIARQPASRSISLALINGPEKQNKAK